MRKLAQQKNIRSLIGSEGYGGSIDMLGRREHILSSNQGYQSLAEYQPMI